jgi:hypothetical protein
MTIHLLRNTVALSIEETAAPGRNAGGVTITPLARRVLVRLPFGGFAWLRPTAVLVERDSSTTRVPIRTVTRVALLRALGATAPLALAVRLHAYGRRGEHR